MKALTAIATILALALGMTSARAVTIDAIYFGQSHVLKADNPYFGLVGSREALIKVHVTDPATPTSPAVTATLSLNAQTLVLPLTGPATLPASIPDGLGVVQHSYANSFTAIIPAAWVKKGLQVTVNAGAASTSLTTLDIGAPTKVIMTMFDVQYFADTTGNYPSGTFAELEAKWPVADLEVRRLGHVVFPELVIPPREDVGTKAARIKSKAEYQVQTGQSFDGEQAAALQWNGALKRAAGRSGRWSLYYLNVYNAFAGGQAGGFAGVGSGTSIGILHHELGHALSLPHWGDVAAYPYKGDMHGIMAPANYNETHSGPAWAFHLPTRAFIPPTTQPGNVGGRPVGVYKVDPMQGGGTGWQEPAYLMNHFSDYSVDQMRTYLQGHVVVWNAALNSFAQWNQTTGDYTTTVTNNGVQYPTTRDVSVISILASLSGANPTVNMVYPPIGPYTAGLIRLFDPTVAADRTAAQSIFSPTNGSDYCVRVVQGGVTKTYMLAASNLSSADPFDSASLITEAVNLPASGGAVTKIELLSTPNVEDVGLPATPTVLYTWAPLMPEPGTYDLPPTANSSSAVTMTALPGEVAFGFTGGTVEYLFTETSGNPGGTSSAWQTSRSYTDIGLQAGTAYSYTVAIRAGALTTTASAPASATTTGVSLASNIAVDDTQSFALQSGNGYKTVTGLGTFDAATADKLVVVVGAENSNNDHFAIVGVRYNGVQMIEAVQQTGITADGAVAIYYLDNPGPIGTGITISSYNPNGGLGAAYALSGTRPGFGAFNSRKGGFASSLASLPLTTSAGNSIVIAALENSNGGTPTANAPLTQVSSGSWGSNWGGFASGYIQVATPGTVTPTFTTTTGSGVSINLAAVEFLSEAVPTSTWVQTAGGAQSWTTAANWILNAVPSPGAGDTVDFSTVDIAANTTLTLGANRTAEEWKFGDTTGTETWTVNAGNIITLAGTAPTIEVVTSTAALNCVLAGSAGLDKTGAGALILTASNTYTGGTTLLNGTLTLNNASAISTGSLTIGGANNPYLTNGSGAAMTLPNNMIWAGNFRLGGSNLSFGSGNVSITANATQEIYNSLTVGGVVSGTFGINKQGTGTFTFNGLNTYAGGTVIRQGAMNINTLRNYGVASALGAPASGNIVIAPNNSSTLNYTGTGDTTNRSIQVGGTGSAGTTATVSNNGTGALVFTAATFNGPVGITTGSAARSLALSGTFGSSTTPNEVQGVIGDNTLNGATAPASRVSLTKGGTGTWELNGANTYTGTTTISSGTLLVNGSLAAASAVAVNGTSTLGGSGTIHGSVTVAADANLAPGASAGTLTVGGNLTISALAGGTGKLHFELAAPAASDRITVGGTLAIGSGALGFSDFIFTPLAGLQAGTYTLMSSGSLTGTLNASNLSGSLGTFTGTLQIAGGSLQLAVAAANPYAIWSGGAAFDADANGDGVDDGMAWLLGAANASASATALLPTASQSSGALVLNFTCLRVAGRGGAVLKVQASNDVGAADPWTGQEAPVPDISATVNGVVFVITTNANPALVNVRATIPGSPGTDLFGRLHGTSAP